MKPNYKSTLHACFLGYITQAVIVNLAPLLFVVFQNDFGLTLTQIGQLVLINFLTQIVTDLAAIRLIEKTGYRAAVMGAHILCAAGLILMSILPFLLPAYPGLLIAVVLYAIGGGLIEVIISPMVDAIPGDAKASMMSLLHSFYCWGQVLVVLVTTVLVKLIGSQFWYILPPLWALIPLFNFFNFMRVPITPMIADNEKMNLRELFSAPIFILALVMMMCSGAAEQAMAQWASFFAEKGLGVPKLLGDLLGPCLFAVFMGIGRTIYGIKGEKIPLKKALTVCAILTTVCYMITVFAGLPVLSLLGCAICGLGVSLMWPGMLSLTSAKCPKGGTAMFAILAMAGDAGCSLGPWLTGLVSDAVIASPTAAALSASTHMTTEQVGLKGGLLIASIFPIIMVAGVNLMDKRKKSLRENKQDR